MVAKAWTDPAYKARLLKDATAAISELGYTGLQGEHMVVVENMPQVHNLVVCTLCSCYPRELLGLPPSWYKSRAYRARMHEALGEAYERTWTYIGDELFAQMAGAYLDAHPSTVANLRRFEKDALLNVSEPEKVAGYKKQWNDARGRIAEHLKNAHAVIPDDALKGKARRERAAQMVQSRLRQRGLGQCFQTP